MGSSNENDDRLAISNSDSNLTATVVAPVPLTSNNVKVVNPTKAKKVIVHYVKVGKYIGKLTNKQYNFLRTIYLKNKFGKFITIASSNYKYHQITIQLLKGKGHMYNIYYKKGHYGFVWDARYGKDGSK